MNENICFGDNIMIKIDGKGKVLFKIKDGGYKIFFDVYYILKLKSNILSIGQFMDRGYMINMDGKFFFFRDR